MKPRALLAALLLTAGLTPLVAPGPATAAPITKAQLLTLDEVESVFPQLLERRDDANQDRFRFGMDAPAYWTSPLRCDHTRLYKGTSRATANTYTLLGPSFNFLESIVQFRTTHQARSVLQHYRDYARVCRGRHATDDGEGGAATLEVHAWRPAAVGDERVGLLDAFTQYGDTQWRRSVVARVGRTVVFTVVEPNRGTGNAAQSVEGARLAVAKLG
jgi:hypothetical protein